MSKSAKARRVAEDCGNDSCPTTWVLNTSTHEVVYTVPSNGVRGKNHVPARKVTVETWTDGTLDDAWECPVCGYAESHMTYDD